MTGVYGVDAKGLPQLRQVRLGDAWRCQASIEVLAGLKAGGKWRWTRYALVCRQPLNNDGSRGVKWAFPVVSPKLPAIAVDAAGALVALLLGTTVIVTPKEEPQINVSWPMCSSRSPAPRPKDVETLVCDSAEQVLSQVRGSSTLFGVAPGVAILTVQYKVGVGREAALVRLWDAIHANRDWVSAQLGVGEPIIKAKGIDDVPVSLPDPVDCR